MQSQRAKQQPGFTLIEMIVSLGIFALVITIAVGSLMSLISSNQRLQGEQSVMTNLAFALDSMTREIRTGYNYYCGSVANLIGGGASNYFKDGNSQEDEIGTSTRDCVTFVQGHQVIGISFFEGGNSLLGSGNPDRRILYFYDDASSTIKRKVGDQDAQSIISSGLEIIDGGIMVSGSEPMSENPGSPDVLQPSVTVFIEAREIGDDKIYRLHTTVTQRILDL
jgi:prepilin-type N-terminal cleavage/methylation domain-containing protein